MPTNYKDYVGPEKRYYTTGRQRFEFLLRNGLTEQDHLLDIGCGSLRLGRLLIPFLLPDRYCGIEPGELYLQEGLQSELIDVYGEGLIEHKRPCFDKNEEFDFTGFGRVFDVIVAFAVFIHCGPTQLVTCLQRVKRVMKPTSVFYVDFAVAADTLQLGRHSKYPWASNQTVRYTLEDLTRILEREGFGHEVVGQGEARGKKGARTLFRLYGARTESAATGL